VVSITGPYPLAGRASMTSEVIDLRLGSDS
jgi:hypothetical protein